MFETSKFVIVENETIPMMHARSELRALGVPEDAIFPSDGLSKQESTFTTWEQVTDKLRKLKREQGWDPKQCTIFLILDVILGRQKDSDNVALDKLRGVLPLWNDYVVVVYSGIADEAARDLKGLVDCAISKDIRFNQGALPSLLRAKLQNALDAWGNRTRRQQASGPFDNLEVRDSLAVRELLGVYGDTFLRDIAIETLGGIGTSTKIDVLTGGYSGAAVLRIGNTSQQGTQSIIVKISRDHKALESELTCVDSASTYGHKFAAAFVTAGRSVSHMALCSDTYYLQYSDARGPTLDHYLKSGDGTGDFAELDAVFALLNRMVAEGIGDPAKGFSLAQSLELKPADIFRFNESISLLAPMLNHLKCTANASDNIKRLSDHLSALSSFVADWNSWVTRISVDITLGYLQHGDLNPRNIIVVPGGGPRLIDFARFRAWPALYDLSRLELQVMRRLFDEDNRLDNFPDRIQIWDQLVSAPAFAQRDNLAWFQFNTQRMALMSAVCGGANARSLYSMYRLSRFFDLIKMVSYHDMSVFKRIWFLSMADRLQSELDDMDRIAAPL